MPGRHGTFLVSPRKVPQRRRPEGHALRLRLRVPCASRLMRPLRNSPQPCGLGLKQSSRTTPYWTTMLGVTYGTISVATFATELLASLGRVGSLLPTNPRGQNCPPYKKTPALQAALVLPHSLACRPIPERYPARRKNSESQSATVRTATDGLPLKITARQRTKSNLSQFETLQPPLPNPTKGEGRQDSSRNRSAIGPQARLQANTDAACSLRCQCKCGAKPSRRQCCGTTRRRRQSRSSWQAQRA